MTMHSYMAPAGITHAVTRLVDAIANAADDVAAVIAPTTKASSGPVADASEGALRIHVLVDRPTDSDGLAMLERFRRNGVDAAMYSVKELDLDRRSGAIVVNDREMARPDLVIPYHTNLDETDMATLEKLEALDIKLLSSTAAIKVSHDKGVTASVLAEANIPHPQTFEVTEHADVRAAVEAVARPGLPVFLKNPVGTQGIGVAGITDVEQAISVGELVTAHGGRRLLIQGGVELPPGTPLHDTRYFIVDGKVIASMDRFNADGQLRGGLHSGGRGEAAGANAAEVEMVERAAAAAGLRAVAGIDVFGGKVLELNYGPGHQIGGITGIDVTGALTDHAIDVAKASRAAHAGIAPA